MVWKVLYLGLKILQIVLQSPKAQSIYSAKFESEKSLFEKHKGKIVLLGKFEITRNSNMELDRQTTFQKESRQGKLTSQTFSRDSTYHWQGYFQCIHR
jgi:hypothetical protein